MRTLEKSRKLQLVFASAVSHLGFNSSMSEKGQSRHFGRRPATSGLLLETEIARVGRHVSKVPKSGLCVDGDLGLTTRSEAALEPPHFSYAHRQAYICPSSRLVMALRAW